MKKTKKFAAILLVLLLSLVASASAASDSADVASDGDTYTITFSMSEQVNSFSSVTDYDGGNSDANIDTDTDTDSNTGANANGGFNSTAWLYNSSADVYYQTGVVYCNDPYNTTYESFGIYVPAAYMNMTSNGNGTYTFVGFTTAKVSGYTAETAPIVIPVNTAGYSAQVAPTGFSSGVTTYTDAGIIYLYAGCRGRDTTNGGAPWGVTDLKAAIRYYRANASVLPGDTDSIFTFGHSGGGAQSAVVGASGDSELYYPYLYAIGAAGIEYDEETGTYTSTVSDAVCGSMCWCPITSLDYADAAYEWMMGQYSSSGTRADSAWTSLLSDDLSEAFAEYINSLTLEDEDGNLLTLTDEGEGIYTSGSYYDYLLDQIEYSLNDFIDAYTDEDGNFTYSASSSSTGGPGTGGPGNSGFTLTASEDALEAYLLTLDENYGTDKAWIIYDEKADWYSITSVEDFVLYGSKSASKDVGAFDDLNGTQAENYVFGNGSNASAHFDAVMAELLAENYAEYAAADSAVSESDILAYAKAYQEDYDSYTADGLLGYSSQYRQDMYNPMYYLCQDYDGYGTSTTASYWRINTGITQSDTSLTVEMNLYLSLLEDIEDGTVESVDFAMLWAQGHTTAERAGADNDECFIQWIAECLASASTNEDDDNDDTTGSGSTHTHSYAAEVTSPATCTEDGVMTYTCTVCGDSYAETIPATGHSYEVVVTAPTCTEGGYTTYTCSVCGDSYTGDETKALGHTWNEGTVTTEATCTEDGVITYTCTVCGETYIEAIAATGHSYEAVVTAPTCTEGGYTTYTCSVCGDSYTGDETEALGHTWDEGTVTTAATCTEDGVMTYTCTACGETYTEAIAATGHTEGEAVIENEVAATCTTEGSYDIVVYCSVCGEELSRETVTVSATGHSYDNGVITTAATCTENGVMTYTCSVCGDTYTEAIAATGHTEGEAVIENEVAATCTTEGSYDIVVYCSVCGEELSRETVTVPATGHSWDEGEVTTEATCTEDGVMTYTCTACGETYTKAIAATGHTEGEAVIENEMDAACTTDGSYDSVVYCSVCSEELSRETVTVPAIGHSYDDGVVTTAATCTEDGVMTYTCTVCGKTYTEAIAATGHSYEAVITTPTCTEGGYTTYTCPVCGDSYTADETGATGHTWDEGTVTTAATCTEDGVMTYTCTACGETYTEAIAATGHTEGAAVIENEMAATCTTDGSYDSVVYCSVCSKELSRETVTVPATGHTAAEVVVENKMAATCTKDGSYDKVIYCSVCGEELSRETVTVPATGHSYEAVDTEPTCTEGGYTTYTCSVCGDSYIANETAATGHIIEVQNAKDATCTEDGYTGDEVCTVCGETVTTGEVIPATGHSYVITEHTDADCSHYETTTYICTVCGDSYTETGTEYGDHVWDGGTCSICGATKAAEAGTLTPARISILDAISTVVKRLINFLLP